MTTQAGELIEVQTETGRWQQGITTAVVSGDTVNCVVFTDGAQWCDDAPWNGNGAYIAVMPATSIAKGSGVGNWRPSTALAGLVAVPGASSSVSLAIGTARNPSSVRSDSRPTRVTVSGTWSWTLNAIGSLSGTINALCDSNSNPTTVVGSTTSARALTAGVTLGETGSMPFTLTFDVPAGSSYKLSTSGTGTFAVSHIDEVVG